MYSVKYHPRIREKIALCHYLFRYHHKTITVVFGFPCSIVWTCLHFSSPIHTQVSLFDHIIYCSTDPHLSPKINNMVQKPSLVKRVPGNQEYVHLIENGMMSRMVQSFKMVSNEVSDAGHWLWSNIWLTEAGRQTRVLLRFHDRNNSLSWCCIRNHNETSAIQFTIECCTS